MEILLLILSFIGVLLGAYLFGWCIVWFIELVEFTVLTIRKKKWKNK